jgi:serine/threonine protein kinase
MKEFEDQRFGGFRLVEYIGSGGFATVYRGERIDSTKEQVAVKILHLYMRNDLEKESFVYEAAILSKLDHPNIVEFLEYGVKLGYGEKKEAGLPYIAMSLGCANLEQRCPLGQQVPLEVVRNYVRQIASALQYAHDSHVIHLDLKPRNILVEHNGNLLVCDFGLARFIEDTHQTTSSREGTCYYMAPEQYKGQLRRESDQYALGIVIYQWLCGNRPFTGDNVELMRKHLRETPPSLRRKRPDISKELEQVILRSLKKDPKKRFESVRAFASAFEKACQSSTMTASSFNQAIHIGMRKLAQPVKVVKVPVVGQYVSDLLPMQPQQMPDPDAPPILDTPNGGLKQNVKAAILLVGVLVIILSSSIYLLARSGSTHSTQTTSNMVKATLNAAATAAPKATATAQANIILTDDLNYNTHNWPVGSYNNHHFAFKDGAYHIANDSPDHLAIALLPVEDVPEPFTYTIKMNEVKGDDATTEATKLNLFGLVLRYNQKDQNNQTFYCFEVKPTNNNAEYQFRKYDSSQTDPWTSIWHQPFGSEYHVGQGASNSNTIKVVANGSNFTFLVNGKQVGSASDNSLQHGQIGMLVNQAGAEIAFSNLILTHF